MNLCRDSFEGYFLEGRNWTGLQLELDKLPEGYGYVKNCTESKTRTISFLATFTIQFFPIIPGKFTLV